MPTPRISVSQLKQLIQLRANGLSTRAIAAARSFTPARLPQTRLPARRHWRISRSGKWNRYGSGLPPCRGCKRGTSSAFAAILDSIKAGKSWQPKTIEIPGVVVTKDNVDKFLADHPNGL